MPYDAYGDESPGQHFVAYGTLLVLTDKRENIDAEISKLKVDRGLPEDDLHCRVLFSGDQRKKSPWSKLTMDEVFKLYSDLVTVVKPQLVRTIVTIADKKELPAEIPGGQWQAANDFVGPMNWSRGFPFRDKQIAAFCAQGTMIPLSKSPGIENLTFWPDPDTSLIELYGGRRQFAHSLTSFIDHGDGQKPLKARVSYLEVGKPALLQVADLVAYVAQRSAHGKFGPNDLKFKALDKAIGAEKIRLGTAPDGGIGFNVANEVRDRRL
jgi:hypothetical protein